MKLTKTNSVYDIIINFDEASKMWRANKKKINGMFYYKCCYRHSNGKRCIHVINPPKKSIYI